MMLIAVRLWLQLIWFYGFSDDMTGAGDESGHWHVASIASARYRLWRCHCGLPMEDESGKAVNAVDIYAAHARTDRLSLRR